MNINRQDQNYLKILKVLYVEDDEDTRRQFSEFLSRPVGTLITAANGAEGLEAFSKHSPDIVVTDILMPQMDGLTMAGRIREISTTVPIIAVTAFEQTDYLIRAINTGIDKYVTKPVNSYLLFESLLECAHRLRAEQQLKLQHQREINEEWAKHNETVAILAGGIAHDYNNLIQAIIGYVSLAKMKLEPDSISYAYLDRVEQCTDEVSKLGHLLRILGNDFYEEMHTGAVMPLILTAIRNTLADSPIVFSYDCPEDLPEISILEHHIEMVFSSLTHNAIDAMPGGGALKLVVCLAEVTEHDGLPLRPGSYLHIKLSDTGSGITPEVLPKIFDPYFSTKEKSSQRGVGMRLAICRTVIMKHGGLITAESTPDNGSTFHIWLPAAAS